MNFPKLIRKYQARRLQRKAAIEAGELKRAGAAGRAMRKLAGLVYRTVGGYPYWGGSRALVVEKVRPLAQSAGYYVTSAKRWETHGNPGSDHYRGNRTAYAEDYNAVNDFVLAQRIRSALDGGVHVDYQTFYVTHRGRRYACQIIAGTHGTGPHLHFGCRLVG